jgi:tetratricopeptide (TPR) repeat protein
MELINPKHTLCSGIMINPAIELYEHGIPTEAISEYHAIMGATTTKPEEAITLLDDFVKKHQHNPFVLCFAIDTYEFLKHEEKSAAMLKQACEQFPHDLLVLTHSASNNIQEGNFEAIPNIFNNKDSLCELYPAGTTISLRALLDWAHTFVSYYSFTQQFEKAQTYVALLHEVCPDHPVELILSDIIMSIQKHTDPSSVPTRDESNLMQPAHEFCNTIRVNTDIRTFFDAVPQESLNLVKSIMKLAGEKSSLALAPTEELLERHPWHSTVIGLCASVYQRLGHTEIAGELIRKAHTRDSDNLLLRSMAARWFTSNGQHQLVPDLFKKSLSLNGLYSKNTELTLLEVSEWAFTLGSYFVMANNIKLAVAYVGVLQELCPELPVTEALSEMLCKATGRTCEQPTEPQPRIHERRGCC